MPVIRKASTSNNVVAKKDTTTKSVATTRVVTVFEELTDVEVQNPQDGFVMIYDSASDKFKLVDPDVALSKSVEDKDLPDDFIEQLEEEINLGEITIDEIDGGGFV